MATYKHDALGRRVEKDLGTSRERYVYSGFETVSVYDSTDTWVRDFVFGEGIDEPLMLRQADVTDFDGDQDTSEVTRHFYHRNALGSVLLLTDMNESEGVSYRYDPYGAVTISVGGTPQSDDPLGNPWMFTARFQDEETGLMYYRARQYAPGVGRFLQRDPLGYGPGANLFEYAGSSPIEYSDPLGRRRGKAFYDEWRKASVARADADKASKEASQAAEQAAEALKAAQAAVDAALQALDAELTVRLGPLEDRRFCSGFWRWHQAENPDLYADYLAAMAALANATAAKEAADAAASAAKERADEAKQRETEAHGNLGGFFNERYSSLVGGRELYRGLDVLDGVVTISEYAVLNDGNLEYLADTHALIEEWGGGWNTVLVQGVESGDAFVIDKMASHNEFYITPMVPYWRPSPGNSHPRKGLRNLVNVGTLGKGSTGASRHGSFVPVR